MINHTFNRTTESFKYIKHKYQTQEMCSQAYIYNHKSIENVGPKFITVQMSFDIIENHTESICYLPEKYLSEQVIEKYISTYTGINPVKIMKGGPDNDFSIALVDWIPKKYFTINVMTALASHHPASLKDVPIECLSEEILVKAVQNEKANSNLLFKYGENDKLILWPPKNLLTKRLLEEAVYHNPHTIENLSEKMKEHIFSDPDFLGRFQENYLKNHLKSPRNKLSFCFSYLPNNALDEKFVSNLIAFYFLKSQFEFDENAARQIPDHILSTTFISNCIDLIIPELDKKRHISDFILYPCYKGGIFCYDAMFPKRFISNDLLEKITLLEPKILEKLPKSLANKVTGNKLFAEKLISKYPKNKEILTIVKSYF